MVSMQDIANELGISRCTVSNIINEKQGYSYKKETIEMVKKTADEMGYVSNIIAQSLKTGSTKTIAIVVPDFANPFYINIVKEIELLANKDDYNIIICMTEEKIEKEKKVLKMLQSRMVDGILISPISYTESLKDIQETKIVCFDRCVENERFPRVIINNKEATKKLVGKLLKENVRKPLFIATSKDDYTIRQRVLGFKEALEEKGYEYSKDRVIYDIYNAEQAYNVLSVILKENKIDFDSIMLSTNYIIYGVIKAIRENNQYEFPIAGFEDFVGSSVINGKYIVAKMPEKKIGEQAYKLLFGILQGRKYKSNLLKVNIDTYIE